MTWSGVVVVYEDDVIEIETEDVNDCLARLTHPSCREIRDGWTNMILVTETNTAREE